MKKCFAKMKAYCVLEHFSVRQEETTRKKYDPHSFA